MNMMMRLMGVALLMFASEAGAAICTSVANGNWSSAATWSCGRVPLTTDAVVIASPNTVVMNVNPTVTSLTVNAGATVDDAGNNLFTSGNVVINGTFGVSPGCCGGGGTITMQGANTTLSGTGSIVNVVVEIDATGVAIPAGSSLNFSMGGQIDVGANVSPAASSLTINGTITGVGQTPGNSIVIARSGATITISGTVNAPLARARVTEGGTIINNGTVVVDYLRGNAANGGFPAGIWTQGPNSTLTVTTTTAGQWAGTFNASATGNTVNYNGTATPVNLTPTPTAPTNLPTFYNLGWPGATCPITAYTILGTSPCAPPVPIVQYHMDESSWSGVAGQVVDSSGSGYNAQSFNNANTDIATPAIASSPGTCRYGVFDNGTTITAGYVQTPLPDMTTNFTVTAWIRTTNNTFSGQRILIDDQNNTGGYGFSLADGTPGRLRFYSRAINPVILDSAYTIANNTWYFVAAVADITNKKRTIYVYNSVGGLLNTTTEASWTGTWGTDAGPVSIGGETNASGEPPASFHFHGNLDEVQVFQTALAQTQLAQLATQTHPCVSAGPDHIQITHNGSALTCTPDVVTITACSNSACIAPHYSAGVSVTLTPGGQAFGIGATGVNNAATVAQSTAGTVNLAATSVPAAINPTTCVNTANPSSPTPCAMTFSNSGFLVTVPNHTSCSTATATIEAVQQGTPANRCVPAYANVTRPVNLYTSYVSPATGTKVVTASTGAISTAAPGTTHSLAFDGTGKATITLSYPDAGSVMLTANDTAPTGAAMTGSATFVAAPASFALSGIPAAPLTAGQAFNTTVTAMTAVSTACPAALATPNFNSPVTLTSANPLPGIGNAAAINSTLSGFTGGAASTNLIWNEVGTIDINANLSNYLGSPLAVAGTQAGVGRFHPAYFETTATPASGTFTYAGSLTPVKAGQPFSVIATAKAFGGVITKNYAGAGYAYNTTLSNAGLATGFSGNVITAGNFVNGIGTINTVQYAMAAPQTAPITLTLRATDADPMPVSSSGHVEGLMPMRSGRMKLSNAYGSELLDMSVPMVAEYFDGTSWIKNVADGSTALAGNITLTSHLLSGATSVSRFNSPLSSGDAGLVLAKSNGAGYVDVGANLGVVAPWLQYPWTGGTLSNPSSRATFGVYGNSSGNNNTFIYRGRRGR
jgi:MSHA biogenesis protein MshQ